MVLDLMLPGMDGIEVCRVVRTSSDLPILMLTARDGVADRVHGLDSGADDYLVKPFAHEELMARIRTLLRRQQPHNAAVLTCGDLEVDVDAHAVRRGNRAIELTAQEFRLLEHFVRNRERVLSRSQLLNAVWELETETTSNVVDVYVRYLRQKLEEGDEVRLLHTIRGVGYVLRSPSEARRPVNFRTRLTWFGALVAALTVLLFGVLLSALVTRTGPETQDQALVDLATRTIAALATAPAATFTGPVLPPVPVDVAAGTEQFIEVVSADGTVIFSTGQVAVLRRRLPTISSPELDRRELSLPPSPRRPASKFGVALQPFARSDLGVSGIVVAGQSTAIIAENLQGLRAVLFIAGLITVLAAWLVSSSWPTALSSPFASLPPRPPRSRRPETSNGVCHPPNQTTRSEPSPQASTPCSIDSPIATANSRSLSTGSGDSWPMPRTS